MPAPRAAIVALAALFLSPSALALIPLEMWGTIELPSDEDSDYKEVIYPSIHRWAYAWARTEGRIEVWGVGAGDVFVVDRCDFIYENRAHLLQGGIRSYIVDTTDYVGFTSSYHASDGPANVREEWTTLVSKAPSEEYAHRVKAQIYEGTFSARVELTSSGVCPDRIIGAPI